MGDRFTVTELRGFPSGGNGAGGEGLSVQVLDNAYRRVLTTFRSEDYGGTMECRACRRNREAAQRASL